MTLIDDLRKKMCNNIVISLSAAYLMVSGCSKENKKDFNLETQNELNVMKTYIFNYFSSNHKPPLGENSDLVKELNGENDKKTQYGEFDKKRIKNGKWIDLWGHPFVYKGSLEWRLYSIGPNGIDENGQGDDIQVKYP